MLLMVRGVPILPRCRLILGRRRIVARRRVRPGSAHILPSSRAILVGLVLMGRRGTVVRRCNYDLRQRRSGRKRRHESDNIINSHSEFPSGFELRSFCVAFCLSHVQIMATKRHPVFVFAL